MVQTGLETQSSQTAIHLPVNILSSLKKEFSISEHEVESFIAAIINKIIREHMDEINSKIFTEAETKEIEDDLKGLGYI